MEPSFTSGIDTQAQPQELSDGPAATPQSAGHASVLAHEVREPPQQQTTDNTHLYPSQPLAPHTPHSPHSLQVTTTQRRLAEHLDELKEEALELEAFRAALDTRRAAAKAEGGGGEAPSTSQKAQMMSTPASSYSFARTPKANYSLKSLAEGTEEESWWARYQREVLGGV